MFPPVMEPRETDAFNSVTDPVSSFLFKELIVAFCDAAAFKSAIEPF